MPDGISIPPIRLFIAVACTALALVLLLFLLLRWLVRRIRYGGRYRGHGSGSTYGYGALSHHSRPSSSSRRYGRGYHPCAPHKKRRRVSRRKYGTFRYYGHSDPSKVSGGHGSEHD